MTLEQTLVLAAFSSSLTVAGILLALLGFLLSRYDALKMDSTVPANRIHYFQCTMVLTWALIAGAASSASFALNWLIPISELPKPLLIAFALIIAIPIVGAAIIKLRW